MAIYNALYWALMSSQVAQALSFPKDSLANYPSGLVRLPVKRHQASSSVGRRADEPASGLIINEQFYYGIEISIGTPPQVTYVEVDTGSDQVWVNPNCSAAPTDFGQQNLCEEIPAYNPSDSSSAIGPLGSSKIAYGSSLGSDLTGVLIDYYNDSVIINGATIKQEFGVASNSLGLPFGIMGLGPPLAGFAINESYPRVLDSMVQQGVINSRAYSLHLGSADDTTGSLVFGGLDKGKFIGALQQVPIVESRDGVTRLTINYDSVSLTSNANSTKQYTLNDTNVLLDSGTTFTTLEENLANQIYADLGISIDNTTGYPLIDCSARGWSGGLTLGFGGSSQKTITVSFRDLIFTAEGLCALGIIPIVEGGQQVLGVSFLRAAYVTFDFDNKNIHIAQAANCTTNLNTFGSGLGAMQNTTGTCTSIPTPAPLSSDATTAFGRLSSGVLTVAILAGACIVGLW
ncbi:aspartic peptidase domain-containing protein [Xylariales sp. PMI_506]|nr:aspartic peptidase domain-containing protein [Xylariales sp. PMI_506]